MYGVGLLVLITAPLVLGEASVEVNNRSNRTLPTCKSGALEAEVPFRFAGSSCWLQLAVGARSNDLEFFDLDRSRYRSYNSRWKSNDVAWRRIKPEERSRGYEAARHPKACVARGKVKVSDLTCWMRRGKPVCKR
jgi:hypothetical protein